MHQLLLNLPFATSYHPADFAESECNKDAIASVRNHREWPSYGLCIVGSPESGKTHLSAVYHSEVPTAHALCAKNLKKKNVFEITAPHIIIDDADQVKDETAFFHLINLVKERKGSLFLTAISPPASWKIRLPDLKSRLCSIPVIHLNDPDEKLLQNILLKLFSDRQMKVDSGLPEYILKHVKPDIQIVRRLVEWLDEEVSRHKTPLNKAIFRNVLFTHTDIMNSYAKMRFLGIES